MRLDVEFVPVGRSPRTEVLDVGSFEDAPLPAANAARPGGLVTTVRSGPRPDVAGCAAGPGGPCLGCEVDRAVACGG
ncbi:hypothetical protein FHR81_000478 [Actinoalloteichus hoggarensis]|nr:hypothetical protein [Actinoalloteichus hoggarensis]MBB5919449.1 hypothetical protein [Actinoalloteichus hoggarensis]